MKYLTRNKKHCTRPVQWCLTRYKNINFRNHRAVFGVWNGNSNERRLRFWFIYALQTQGTSLHCFVLFPFSYKRNRYAARLYILVPWEKQERLTDETHCSCSVPSKAGKKTSRSKNVKDASFQKKLHILNGAYMRHSLKQHRPIKPLFVII